MFEREIHIPVQQVLHLLAQEKEDFSRYCQLCAKMKTAPDPTARAVHETRIDLLTRLKDGVLFPVTQSRG